MNVSNTDKQTEPPSAQIDAALCDLIMGISNFSDDEFDAFWLQLSDLEVERITVLCIQILTFSLTGVLLKNLLFAVRSSVYQENLFTKFEFIIVDKT